jgi:hypothetical protein
MLFAGIGDEMLGLKIVRFVPKRTLRKSFLPAAYRHSCSHRGRSGDPARHFDGSGGDAVFHLASSQHAENLVVNIEGRDLTIGYPDRFSVETSA